MIIRFSAFHQALASGQFPVRFLPRLNFEYGYPVANFLYPGFMYLGEFIHVLKFGFVDTVKIIFGLSFVIPAIFTYQWLSKIFNKWPALFGSLFFLYNPYHLFDTYRRGSLGEALAIGIIPIILWSIESGHFLIYSFLIGFLIISHNTLALLFLPLIFIYILLKEERKRKYDLLKYAIFSILGIGLATFFWFPAVYDLQFTIFSQTKISDWENYFSGINLIGIANIIVLLATASVLLSPNIRKQKSFSLINPKQKKITIFFFIISSLAIFFALPLSTVIWKLLPVSVIQFPFRILSVSIIGFAFLGAFILSLFKTKIQILLGIVITLFLLAFSSPYILKNEYFDKGEGYYSTNEATTTVKNEYMPKWVKQLPLERPQRKVEVTNTAITAVSQKPNNISFTTQSAKNTIAIINTIYFPGWQATIDGKKTKIGYNNPRGLIEFSTPAGRHQVIVEFGETPVRLISDMISLQSFFILCFLLFRRMFKNKRIKI
jgi:hypothetical protein